MNHYKRIGLALSGGGMRALIYHLGIIKYIAENGKMAHVSHISTVSGASLCVALIYTYSGNRWPDDKQFLNETLPAIRRTILDNDIQIGALLRLPFLPQYWNNRVGLVARMMEKKWKVKGNLDEIDKYPLWEINCTTYETASNFRISTEYMGDQVIGYSLDPNIPIADMAAASAGFPILIGPYKLDTTKFEWSSTMNGQECSGFHDRYRNLWDGGVYDNIGLEPLFKPYHGMSKTIDYLIISDAGAPLRYQRKSESALKSIQRVLNIVMAQSENLRLRDVRYGVLQQGNGIVANIQDNAGKILGKYKNQKQVVDLIGKCLSPQDALEASNFPTTLCSPNAEQYDLILRHGYECTKCEFLRDRIENGDRINAGKR